MKEIEEWKGNPRDMFVWNKDDKSDIHKEHVVFGFAKSGNEPACFLAVSKGRNSYRSEWFAHCAEIERRRRMTHKELSRWLREKPHREWKMNGGIYIHDGLIYSVSDEDVEVNEGLLVREDDGEWHEPLAEEEFDEKQGGKDGE